MPMYNDNNRKLRTFLLVLTIVLVLLRIVKVAKADSYDYDNYNSFVEIIDHFSSYLSSSEYDLILSTLDDYDNIHCLFDLNNNSLMLEATDNLLTLNSSVTSNTSPNSVSGTYMFTNVPALSPSVVTLQLSSSGCELAVRSFSNVQYSGYTISTDLRSLGISCYQNTTTYLIDRWSRTYIAPLNSCFYYTDGYDKLLHSTGTYIDAYSNNSLYFTKELSLVSYSDDSRLKFWTYNNLDGSETLVTSLDDFCIDSIFVQNEFTNIVLTYELDNIEHTVSLNSSNSVIRSTQNQNGGNITYKLETPFSVFGFDDSTVSFKITKCDFTYVKTTMGNVESTAYKISCNYSAYSRSVPVEPAVIPSPASIYDDPASSVDIADREFDFFQQLQTSVMGGDIVYVNNYPTLPAWANVYNLNTFFYDNNPDDLHIYLGTQITGAYRASQYDFDIKAFLYDNATSKFYDVIIIRIDDTEWPMVVNSNTIPDSQELYGYVVLYTDSYYKRLDAETQIDILEAIQLDANQQLANWSWLVSKINDFEDKTLDALNANLDINTDSLSWLKTIDNSIKSLDFPDFDDSSILSDLASIVISLSGNGSDELGVNGRLDKLINFFIANDAQKNDSALTYRNWLDGLDTTETRRVTHFGTNIYSLVKNIFDIFDADYTEDPSFENPDKDYLGIASDFIDALNNIDNSNKFFRGFFDSSFDPLEQSGLPEE